MSPDGRFIISGSKDKSIRVFDIQTKQQIHRFKDAHDDEILSVAVSSDGQYIIAGSRNKTIKCIKLPQGRTFRKMDSKRKFHETFILS